MTKLQQTITDLKSQITEVETDLAAANATIDAMTAQLGTANDALAASLIERQALQAKVADLETKLAVAIAELDALKNPPAPDPTPTPDPTPDPVPTPDPTPSADDDFAARKSAPGVVRYFDFNDPSQLGNTKSAAIFGSMAGSTNAPTIDAAVKASGTGSLRFDIQSQTGSNGGGSWYANFSDDLQTQFGENSEFYVQWRQRFSQAFVDTVYVMTGGTYGGIKQAIIGTGDRTAVGDPLAYSCSNIDLVTTTYAQHRAPTIYNTCITYTGLYESVPPGPNDFRLQNGMPPYYLYSNPGVTPNAVGPGGFGWVADEWMTFEIRVKTGPRNATTNRWDASEVQLWGAREGGEPFLIIDWRPGIPGYFPLYAGKPADNERFGKVWLLPYQTSKDPTQVHPPAQTWYDELIISRQPIAFPGGKTLTIPRAGDPAPVPTPVPDPTPIPYPTPTPVPVPSDDLAPNTARDLGPFNLAPALGDDSGSTYHFTDESIWHYDAKRNRLIAFGGGHSSTNYDALVELPLDTLTWRPVYQATPRAMWYEGNYDAVRGAWLSGGPTGSGPYPRAVTRHTLDETCIAGDEFLVLGRVEGNFPNLIGDWKGTTQGGYSMSTPGKAAHYSFVTGQWSFADIAGQYEVGSSNPPYGACEYDPVSGKVVLLSYWALSTYDPATKTRVELKKFMERSADLASVVDAAGQPAGTNAFTVFGYIQNLVYAAVTDRMYYVKREPGGALTVFEVAPNRGDPAGDWANAKITRLNPTNAPTITETDEIGFAYDFDNKLIGTGPYANKFHAFDPVANSWQTKIIGGTALPGTLGSRTHAIAYTPKGYVFSAGNGHTWPYRWQ